MFTARSVLVALSALLMTASGVMDLVQPKPLVEGFGAIGLPMTVATVVGGSKLAGVLALGVTSFVPAAPRWLREWAWAGFCIDLAGAALLHVLAGDHANVANPIVPLLLVVAASVLDRQHPAAQAPV